MKQKIMEIKTITLTEKGQIAIPKEMRTLEGFKIGTKLVMLAFPDHLEIRALKKFSEGMECMLASQEVLAKDWNSKEDEEAWKNL